MCTFNNNKKSNDIGHSFVVLLVQYDPRMIRLLNEFLYSVLVINQAIERNSFNEI